MLLDRLYNTALPLSAALFGSCIYGSLYVYMWKKLVYSRIGESMFALGQNCGDIHYQFYRFWITMTVHPIVTILTLYVWYCHVFLCLVSELCSYLDFYVCQQCFSFAWGLILSSSSVLKIVTPMVCERSWHRRNCMGYQGWIKGWVSWAATWGATL